MNTKKYAVYPGFVRSSSDGARHYITAEQLCFLYGVSMEDCIVVRPNMYLDPSMRGTIDHAVTLPRLGPRWDGKYKLPKETGQ